MVVDIRRPADSPRASGKPRPVDTPAAAVDSPAAVVGSRRLRHIVDSDLQENDQPIDFRLVSTKLRLVTREYNGKLPSMRIRRVNQIKHDYYRSLVGFPRPTCYCGK